jgi:hypothetical protein
MMTMIRRSSGMFQHHRGFNLRRQLDHVCGDESLQVVCRNAVCGDHNTFFDNWLSAHYLQQPINITKNPFQRLLDAVHSRNSDTNARISCVKIFFEVVRLRGARAHPSLCSSLCRRNSGDVWGTSFRCHSIKFLSRSRGPQAASWRDTKVSLVCSLC